MKKISFPGEAWIFLPAIPYFVVLFQNAPNIPIMDDYDAILNFICDWRTAGFTQKLSLLFLQTNEHRILYSRLVYVLYYSLFGNINFRNLIIFADLQLLVIAAIAVYFTRKYGGKYWRIIAFLWVLCIFDLNTFESGSIAMYGMQCYGLVMLFFVSLFFFELSNKWLAMAAIFEALCIFSSGNGMIGAVFIVLCTFLSGDKLKKTVSLSTAAVCISLYFVHYTFFTQPDRLPFNLGNVIVFFIRSTGAPLNFDLSLILGILVLAALGAAVFRKPFNAPWPILCIIGFALASMGTTALFRANLKGIQFQTSRYLIYPQLLLAAISMLGWLKLEKTKYNWIGLGGMVVVLLHMYSSNFEFGKMGFRRTAARAEAFPYYYPDAKHAKKIADEACQEDIYCLKTEKSLLSAE